MLPELSPIEDVIADAREGKMFILVDDEHRENEGDLIIPAQMADAVAINFMAKYGRGLICLALPRERVEQLQLPLMPRTPSARQDTAFTVSIEAKEGVDTGISAADRATTIAAAIDGSNGPESLVTPGHVFPLIARDGGVLVRAGHTEAAVDIARLAGHTPAGVICEIMNDDGTMARLPDLIPFAKQHGLKIATIADLIAYRRTRERLVERVRETDITSEGLGECKLIVYASHLDGTEHIALVKGDVRGEASTWVRMHVLNILNDVVGDTHFHKADELRRVYAMIRKHGSGVVVILREPTKTAISHMLDQRDPAQAGGQRNLRDYGLGAQILLDLGVKAMMLLTNSPPMQVVGLEGFNLEIHGVQSIV